MKQFFLATALALLILAPAAPSMAKVDWQASPVIATSQAPLDIAVSSDGKRTFVLTAGNTVEIYNQQGKLDGTIPVEKGMDRIAAHGKGGKITVSSSKNKQIQVISVDFIASFAIDGSPFLGNSAAPVEMAVFSDFQ